MRRIEVVAAVIEKDDKIFCAQRNLTKSMGGKWEFPGGKIEVGETNEEALVREISEEFDMDIKALKFIINNIIWIIIKMPLALRYFSIIKFRIII